MKNESLYKVTPFPARFLTVTLVLTGAVLVTLIWFTFDSYQNAATGQLRNLRIEELRGVIVHLDEVLTTSARMAATTGDPDWERRYRHFEPQLEAAITEAEELTAHLDRAHAAAQMEAANLKLVEMENQGFNLVRAGEAARAKAVLFSDAYEEQKKIYTEGMDKFIQHLEEQLNSNQLKKQREAFLAIIAIAVCIVLLFFTWLLVLRSLNSWQTTQSTSLNALTRAEEALRKLNDELEKRVEDRTRSLELEIRERKGAEAEVQQSQKRLRDLMDGLSPSMFVGLLTPQGILIEINQSPLTAAGLTPEDVLGKPFDETPWWSQSPAAQQQLREAIARGARGEASRYDVRTHGVGDQVIDIDFSLQPLRDETGEVAFLIPSASDITDRKRAEEETMRLNAEVANQRERLDTMIANVQGVVWETKTRLEAGEAFLRFAFVSDYIETMLGYTAAECLDNPSFWLDIVHPDDRKKTEEMILAIFAGGKGGTVEFRWISKDGHEIWVESRNMIIRDEVGKAVGLRGIAVDITERKLLEEQLTHQALHDPLTKLGNRVLFRDRVEHAIERTRRKHSPIAVLFLDLDNFKSVNDSLGHAAGDELLVSVTERLQACLRASDTPARLGGDEFAILLEDLEHIEQASLIAERIRTVLCSPFSIAGTEVFISSSIGIAITSEGRETPEDLLRNADVAMYSSKGKGKDQFTIFENEMHDVLLKRIRLESDMRLAIQNNEFEVYYQPILDLDSERVMGMEALVRWNHPGHGLIAPLDFIPLAEETGLIVPLGKWILEEACLRAREWQIKYGYGDQLSITVNVASRQFLDESLPETVKCALALSELPPRSLILEITESTMLSNTETTIQKLNELKTLGIRFAIDDFGTGYSSLSYLQRFPVDLLKIDKSFIDKIALDKGGAAVAKAIITMSTTLNLKTIAEGIESAGQQTELQRLGCELGQGYHFAKPLKATEMNKFLQKSLSRQDSVTPLIQRASM